VRRQPDLGSYDRKSLDGVLDAGLVAHVAFVVDGQPFCIPMLYARIGDELYIHGSAGSRAVRALASGIACCVTVTLLDGLVLARSVFEHSANYRCVILLGTFRTIEGADERGRALEGFTNKLLPGRWDEARQPNDRELAATSVLGLALAEASAKVRVGSTDDDESPDAELDVWAGVIPFVSSYGEPEPAPGLRAGIPIPASVRRLLASPKPGRS
jgi:nitroimidazol reductase NimA-like FMN-containing flavoprotein (pyridoxamine 5'-phosphate oxidase superfamily)